MTDTNEPNSSSVVPNSKANIIIAETVPSETDSNQDVGISCMYEDVELGEATLTDNQDMSKTSSTPSEPSSSLIARMMQCVYDYDFLLGLIVAILLAKAYPPLGAEYLQPQITATWIAVIYIFLISGLSLATDEFKNAFKQLKFHIIVQAYNFFFVSGIVYGITRILITTNAMVPALADGMVICSCLPMAINMVIIMSQNADGDVGVAVFNSAFGNMLGVFLSPGLILGYLGVSGDVDLGKIFYKLVLRVVVPIVVGQVARISSKAVANLVTKHKFFCGKSQMYALLFIVYTVFCDTFATGASVATSNFILALFFQLILLLSFMIFAWFVLRCTFPNHPQLCVTGVMGCCFKTVSLGVPLINSMYEGNSNLALYILPLLMWYPMQLTIGSLLTPHMYKFVQKQKERLSGAGVVVEEDDGNNDEKNSDVKD